MKKHLLTIFVLVFIMSTVYSQNFIVIPKYSFIINNDYSSNEICIEGLYEFDKVNLDLGVMIGIVDMKYGERKWASTDNGGYKLLYGFKLNYFPFGTIFNKLRPYLGAKYSFVSDKSLFLSTGGNHVFESGFYFPKSSDDNIISPILGTIVTTESVGLIIEVEYEFRNFNLGYSEYYDDEVSFLIYRKHNKSIDLNSILINIGLRITL